MVILQSMTDAACDHCGKVYAPGWDRFWSGGGWECTAPDECETNGGVHDTLCDDCHRDLVRS